MFSNASFLIVPCVCRGRYTEHCKKSIFKFCSKNCASLDEDFSKKVNALIFLDIIPQVPLLIYSLKPGGKKNENKKTS